MLAISDATHKQFSWFLTKQYSCCKYVTYNVAIDAAGAVIVI